MKQLVIGLGESGLAMVRHAVSVGTAVSVYDSRSAPALLPTLTERCPDVSAHCGDFNECFLDGVTQVAISPGLSPHASPLREILSLASARNIAVVGELDLFARALVDLQQSRNYAPKVLAVTGTNGKTTVTALTRHLCESAGMTAMAAGNISPSMLDALSDALALDSLPDVWVLELSSFQLQFAREFNADAATVLNISQDHLDWHADMAEYVAAKAKIFGAHTLQVLNRDDAEVMAMAREDLAQASFGVYTPSADNQYGLWRDGAMDWLASAHEAVDDMPKKKRGKANDAAPAAIERQRLMPMNALKIKGRHNAMNALAALALCRAIEIPLAKLLHGLRTYEGEPHRVQFVTNVNGVDFYDDSKGTNVGATLAALQGMGQPIVLIAGGDGKGQDFSPLFEAVKAHVKRIDLIGKDAATLRDALMDTGVTIVLHDSLEAATAAAAAAATAGDAVLLSPACASLDMFKNYSQRAEVFVAAVHEWALSQGQIG
ncbi:MAG: UDP-N-acetylmuramoyl-L-alanine--D-glutamate ligase [Formosimonas sp.]